MMTKNLANNSLTISNNITNSNNLTIDIQAQFELCVELRRFINIDLFQRGYYQIRTSVKFQSKQIPIKVVVELENNKNNLNLSESMFPNCVFNEYAVSKTFLILYRNEEIILDDHILFKITTIVNLLNIIESFKRLDLQLNIELWFTDTDYNLQTISQMQQLCVRNFKIHFDPRFGIHLQIPILFDYFHLSAVLTTIHCVLLTLLPPMTIYSNVQYQKSSSLSAILYGKDISYIKSDEVSLLKRASFIHDLICSLLLQSYENLQNHLIEMREFLTESKKFKFDYLNCKERINNLSMIIAECNDFETLDDLANRHVSQCSAENIMLWCLYLDNFTLNDSISLHLAIEYHYKRFKRFSEAFLMKQIPKEKLLNFYEESMNINYTQINEIIHQSQYYLKIPYLIVECTDLDGVNDNTPLIFEEVYIDDSKNRTINSKCYTFNTQKLDNASYSKNESFSSRSTNSSSSSYNDKINKISKSKEFLKKSKKSNSDIIASESNSIRLVSYRKVEEPKNDHKNLSILDSIKNSNLVKSEFTSSLPLSSKKTIFVKKLSIDDKNLLIKNCDNDISGNFSQSIDEKISEIGSQIKNNNVIDIYDSNERAIDVESHENRFFTDINLTPSDCSLKSRVLYESFRGRMNTLDRRKTKLYNRIDLAINMKQNKMSTNSFYHNTEYKKEHKRLNNEKEYNSLIETNDNNSDNFFMNDIMLKQFNTDKELIKRFLQSSYQGVLYSDFSLFCQNSPYFYPELTPKLPIEDYKCEKEDNYDEKLHLIICVHGLDGNSGDLRLIRTYLELALAGAKMEFLMSECNQNNTFEGIENMTEELIKEIFNYIDAYGLEPSRISFIGHSLGNLIIRSTVVHQDFFPLREKLYTFLSLSGPHLGTLYNTSGLINMGMWIMQKWKKSGSLLQLSLKDNQDLSKTFLFQLSEKPSLQCFKNILIVSCPQDRYVPFHSSRIEMCKSATKDTTYGDVYKKMVYNILTPIINNPEINFVRYTGFHTLPSGTSNLIGRAAHIAVLDSELFVEKLILVSVAKYFR